MGGAAGVGGSLPGGADPGEAGAAGAAGDANWGPGGAAGSSGAVELPPCGEDPAFFITGVVDSAFGPGQDVGQDEFPEPILGPPRGGGVNAGSSDVVSLGEGGWVVVEFAGNAIVDGPGTDFLVFENPFLVGGDPSNPFAELGEVAVSQDGHRWLTFPCERREYPYDSCAGWHPVLAGPDGDAADQAAAGRDPTLAGGDPFDLADVGLAWARYVRVTDAADGAAQVFDLDAMAIVHAACEAAPR